MSAHPITPKRTPADETVWPEVAPDANEYGLYAGENMANHTFAMAGRPAFVTQTVPSVPQFRTMEEVWRYAAHLLSLAEALPHEEPPLEWEHIRAVISGDDLPSE